MTDKYAVQFELGIQAEDISSYFVFYLQFHIYSYITGFTKCIGGELQ